MENRTILGLLGLVIALLLAGCSGSSTLAPANTQSANQAQPTRGIAASGGSGATPAATSEATAALPTSTAAAAPSETMGATTAPAATTGATAAPTVTATAASGPILGPVPALPGDPRTNVITALNNVLKAGPYRETMTLTSGSTVVQSSGEVILPDKFHLITQGQEILAVGGKTYIKVNGTWNEFPMDMGSMMTSMLGALTPDIEKGITDVQLAGTDTIQGKPATIYQFNARFDEGGTPITSTVKMLVDNARVLPVRQELVGNFNGKQSTTVQNITYDPTITIEPPTK